MTPSQKCCDTSEYNPRQGNFARSKGQKLNMIFTKRIRSPVHFSPMVGVRFFLHHGTSTSWMEKDEIENIKRRAKALSKQHRHLRWKRALASGADFTSGDVNTVGDAARYEIKGESLRGMEHITDYANGRKRRRVQEEAIRAAVIKQTEQLVQHRLLLTDSGTNASAHSHCVLRIDDQAKGRAANSNDLAELYKAKTEEALAYAQRVAQEDSKVAAEILANDLLLIPRAMLAASSCNTGKTPQRSGFLPR